MASRFICRSTALLRRFSTVSEMLAPVGGSLKSVSFYEKFSEMKIKPDSDRNLKVMIDEWASDKRREKLDIIKEINFFRSRKNYNVAIQLSDWMVSRIMSLNDSEQAIWIDLLGRTRSIDSAEMYFNGLKESAKSTRTYGALLNCYCKGMLFDKAVELFTQMKQLKYSTTLNYNNMLALYTSSKQHEQVPLLFEEMKQNGLKPGKFTYNLLINSYAAQKDFDAMEEVLEDMKINHVKCDWFTYGNLATIHINAGSRDKARGFIQRMEKESKNTPNPEYFNTLITLNRELSDLPGVYCSWEALRCVHPTPTNTNYLIMLLALSKLGDVEGLEKCYREWESGYSLYDVRLTNVILESYLQRNMIEEANALFESIAEKGSKPSLTTFDMLARYHIKKSEIDPALDYLKVGAAEVDQSRGNRFPSDATVKSFLKFFEKQTDVNGAQKFCDIMKMLDRLDPSVYESLLSPKVSSRQVVA